MTQTHRVRRIVLYVSLMLSLVLIGCKKSIPEDLEQAKDVLTNMASPIELHNSMFSAAYPECRPSEYVHYLFSTLGAAEMPSAGGGPADGEGETGSSTGRAEWPDGVEMVPLNVDPQKGKQLVLKPNDEKGTITLELYENPAGEPLATFELNLPKVTPSDMAKAAFHSNVEMGATY